MFRKISFNVNTIRSEPVDYQLKTEQVTKDKHYYSQIRIA